MPVTVKRYLQGSQLLGNLLSVSGVSSCPTLSQSRRRPPPVRWLERPREEGSPRPAWWGGARLDGGGAEPGVCPIRSRPAGAAALERPRGNRIPSGKPGGLLGEGRRQRQMSRSMPGAEWECVRSLTARGTERAAGGPCYSGCGPSFAGAGIRPVRMTLFAERPNRRDRASWGGAAVGVAPDPPAYTIRGAHVGGPIPAEGFSSTGSRPGTPRDP